MGTQVVTGYTLAQLPQRLPLANSEVQVWQLSLEPAPAFFTALYEILSADEHERAQRFHDEKDYQRFVVSHGVLRVLLGKYCDCAPQELAFSYLEHGKPILNGGYATQFNLSHSGSLAVFAFAAQHSVGIDVEYVKRELDYQALARRYFSVNEIAAMEATPEHNQKQKFFEYWTRKEALLKATGEGISRTLNQLDVTNSTLVINQSDWMLQPLQLSMDYVGSVAIDQPQAIVSEMSLAL